MSLDDANPARIAMTTKISDENPPTLSCVNLLRTVTLKISEIKKNSEIFTNK